MECRAGCGACCIAASISSPMPGHPNGKPAGVACANLTADNLCALFGSPERPHVCQALEPTPSMCGTNRDEALARLRELEEATDPNR